MDGHGRYDGDGEAEHNGQGLQPMYHVHRGNIDVHCGGDANAPRALLHRDRRDLHVHAQRPRLLLLEGLALLIIGVTADSTAYRAGLNRSIELLPAVRQALTVRRREPQAEEQPLVRRIFVVDELGARVQRRVAVDDLHVARLQPHRIRKLVAPHDGVELLERGPVLFGELRNAGQLLRVRHAVPVPPTEKLAAGFPEDRLQRARTFIGRLFALAAEVNGTLQPLHHVGMLFGHNGIRIPPEAARL
jgi:hypothetical protein